MINRELLREAEAVPVSVMAKNSVRFTWAIILTFIMALAGSVILFLPFVVLSKFVGYLTVILFVMLITVVDAVGSVVERWNDKLKSGNIVKRSFADILRDMADNWEVFKLAIVAFYIKMCVLIMIGALAVSYVNALGYVFLFALLLVDDFLEKSYNMSLGSAVFRWLVRRYESEKYEEIRDFNPLKTIFGELDGIAI